MTSEDPPTITAFVEAQRHKPTLSFITCGSVDDGKCTLNGRLLLESKAIFDDQLKAPQSDSRRYGTQGDMMDLALLVDSLQAEREQGIRIDVAYRFFATDRRRYVVADRSGHEQYTRNMAIGASTADLAAILIDARKGMLTQTQRHSRIVAMMCVRDVALAVNKMDLMEFDEAVFNSIVQDYREFAADLGFDSLQAISVSGLDGDIVLSASGRAPVYGGPSLMQCLDTVQVRSEQAQRPLRMPVQWVNRPNVDFHGFSGRLAAGVTRVGDAVRMLRTGVQTRVLVIWRGFEEVAQPRLVTR